MSDELKVKVDNPCGYLYKILDKLKKIQSKKTYHEYVLELINRNNNDYEKNESTQNHEIEQIDVINFTVYLNEYCEEAYKYIKLANFKNEKRKEKLIAKINYIKQTIFKFGIDTFPESSFNKILNGTVFQYLEDCSDYLSEQDIYTSIKEEEKNEIYKEIEKLYELIDETDFEIEYKLSLFKIINDFKAAISIYEDCFDKNKAIEYLEKIFGKIYIKGCMVDQTDEKKICSLNNIGKIILEISRGISALDICVNNGMKLINDCVHLLK